MKSCQVLKIKIFTNVFSITVITFVFFLFKNTVGISTKHEDFLKFLFEYNEDFCALPTFAVLPVLDAITVGMMDAEGLGIDPTKVVCVTANIWGSQDSYIQCQS